jgi:two-component system NtrC family sensor kinase
VIKYLKILFLLSGTLHFAVAQQNYILDSLRKKLNNATREDTSRVQALNSLAQYYGFVQFDSAYFYATKGAQLSEKLNYEYGKLLSYQSRFFAFNVTGNFPMAMEQALNYENSFEQLRKKGRLPGGGAHYFVGFLYLEMGDYPAAIAKLQQCINEHKETKASMPDIFFCYSQLGILYNSKHQLDSALLYAQQGYELGAKSSKYFKKFYSLAIGALGTVHVSLGHYKLAEDLFRYGIQQSGQFNNIYFQARNYYSLAKLFDKENLKDSAIYYASVSLRLCIAHNFSEFTLAASKLLTSLYDSEGKTDSTLKYMRIELAAKDSVFSQSKVQQFQKLAFDEVQRQQKISVDQERYQNKVRLYILLAALIVFSLLAFILYRNNRQKQKAKIKIEKAYSELKSTQSQLIQSEKMASLGELTAGIAHEIQNPLNFVNNFSEVNTELIDELEQEVAKGNLDEVKTLAKDIKENEGKINHHGKRADAIVKGMLQHSRSSTGAKELTDINALADEYLRLSYHGLRAKDNSFNATMKTDFDVSIGKINIIPQDIGRVFLNLYNNAFYTIGERRKAEGLGYEPTVTAITRLIQPPSGGRAVEIKVIDNGGGIPQKVVDKIFQPFFTTKPTGQGTGLGLSLSYDIIKAHGGEIKVITKENEGTEFVIHLPINNLS